VSTRRKKRGYRLPPGKFMSVPYDVLKRAHGVLTAPELRVFICLCAQSQPWSNGTAKLTRGVMAEYHLGSYRVVASATRKLLDNGFIHRTRNHRQHVCAMFAMRHLPVNVDALAKEGVSATNGEALDGESSATNSGSAAVLPTGKRYRYHIGSTEPVTPPSVLPMGKRKGTFSTVSVLPMGKQSKNLPSTPAKISGAAKGRKGPLQ
jgi:hypothetical protein